MPKLIAIKECFYAGVRYDAGDEIVATEIDARELARADYPTGQRAKLAEEAQAEAPAPEIKPTPPTEDELPVTDEAAGEAEAGDESNPPRRRYKRRDVKPEE